MPPDLVVGARGWDHQAWQDSFYPDDLPADWRLGYYANEFRGVLVPGGSWAGDADPRAWLEDVPDDFSFWLELNGALIDAHQGDGDAFLSRIRPLLPQVAGLYPVPGDAHSALLEWRHLLARHLPSRANTDHRPAQAWRPGHVGPCGCLGFIDEDSGDPRILGSQLRQFLGTVQGCERALLCFAAFPSAPARMSEARVIAELSV